MWLLTGMRNPLWLAGCIGLVCVAMAQAAEAQTLREAAKGRFLIGAAIMSRALDDPATAALLATQFSTITSENELKPMHIHPQPGTFNFAAGDRMVAFAQQHKLAMIGHTLCWHGAAPPWLFADAEGKPLPREQGLANLKEHIQTVVAHFRGKIKGWDVVNEALGDGAEELRDTPARRSIGDDFVLKAFEFAHAADANVELYYNDFSIERPGKREKAVRLIRQIKAAGLRIDAIGIQGHWNLGSPDLKMVEEAIEAFAAEGVRVNITELDLDVLPRKSKQTGADVSAIEAEGLDPYKNGCPPEILRQQAERYAGLFRVFLKHRAAMDRVTFWCIHDGNSWLNNYPVRGRINHPLLWDRQLKPKPAFEAVMGVLKEGGEGG